VLAVLEPLPRSGVVITLHWQPALSTMRRAETQALTR